MKRNVQLNEKRNTIRCDGLQINSKVFKHHEEYLHLCTLLVSYTVRIHTR